MAVIQAHKNKKGTTYQILIRAQFIITDISKDRLFHEKGRRMHGSPILAQTLSTLLANEQFSLNR